MSRWDGVRRVWIVAAVHGEHAPDVDMRQLFDVFAVLDSDMHLFRGALISAARERAPRETRDEPREWIAEWVLWVYADRYDRVPVRRYVMQAEDEVPIDPPR